METDLRPEYGVLVVGDEVESVLTAVSAARAGVDVLLARRSTERLGGLSVRGGLSYMDITPDFATGLFREFLDRAGVVRVALNPDRAHAVLLEMLAEAGVTIASGVAVSVETDEAGYPVVARLASDDASEAFELIQPAAVVDATPDADVMRPLGVPFTVGLGGLLGEDENFLGISPVFRLTGVTVGALQEFEASLRAQPDLPVLLNEALPYHAPDLREEYRHRPTFAPEDMDYLDILNPVIGIDFYRWRHGRVDDYSVAPVFIDGANISRLADGSLGFNGLVARPVMLGYDLDDLLAMSQGGPIPEELQAAMRDFERYLRDVAGFADVRVVPPDAMYIRQTVNVLSRSPMTAAEMLRGGVPASEAVATFSYWLDLRGTQMWRTYPGEHLPKPVFHIGLGAALPPAGMGLENMAVVGRSAGYSPIGQGAGRIVQHNSLLGEAVGLAAALAVTANRPLSEIATREIGAIQEALRKRHGHLPLSGHAVMDEEAICLSRLLAADTAVVERLRMQVGLVNGAG